jgi:formylglycine-generating enzyme required for sulfatase activity
MPLLTDDRIALRDFVNKHLSRDEVFVLASDYFHGFYQDHEGSRESKTLIINKLIGYCEQREVVDNLRAALQKERPAQYAARFGRLPVAEVSTHPRDPHQVFLSHAHEDADFAQRLARDLREAGLSVWMTPDSIQPGEQWVSAIDRGLSESGVFVVALTPNAVRSRWVKKETQWAVQAEQQDRVRLFPLLVQPCDAAQLSNLLTLTQFVNFERGYERGVDELCRALGVQSARMRAAAQLAAQNRAQQEAAEMERLRTENERLKQAAAERETQQAAEALRQREAAERERLRKENERLRREAGQRAKPQSQPPRPVSRRAVLLGLGGLAGVGALGLGAVWLNSRGGRLATTAVPAYEPEPTAQLQSTASPQVAVVSADEFAIDLAPGVPMIFRRVPAGNFLMGSDKAKAPNARDDEMPQHTVFLSEYYIGKHEVTNAQWAAFAEATGRAFYKPSGKADHPVVGVSWEETDAFCKWASQQTGQTVQLPTEAQWEKAARGADGRIYPWGDVFDHSKANTADGGKGNTTPVGSFSPQGDSPYGITNMAGNVWEWCADWYDKEAYQGRDTNLVRDPIGPTSGTLRVLRGGSFINFTDGARCAYRGWNLPVNRYYYFGFRVVVRSAPVS